MKNIFQFGERIDKFKVRVLNEREVRAAAGILFLFAFISFSLALFKGNFQMTKFFVIVFLVDFFIRIFVNPKYSPSLILGRFFVRNQKPEYVGAPQKRFAWAIGFLLAATMFVTIVVLNTFSPLNGIVCLLCLLLLFFESAFGICLGCIIYNFFNKEKAKLCPGGTCEIREKEEIQKINIYQVVTVTLFILGIVLLVTSGVVEQGKDLRTELDKANSITESASNNFSEELDKKNKEQCIVPQWAIEIGHEKQYREHKCK